ncbi:hypothetical protein J4471_05345 [Candidatus Woesearchaeota archaeon]|nr:hypothetical protein [Candidatus Woesearchaeota archaeon]
MRKSKIIWVLFVIASIALVALETWAQDYYYSYDSDNPRNIDLESSVKYREQVKYELSENLDRTDNYNRLRRNRFLYDSPYYYDRVYYNRGNRYQDRYITDNSYATRSTVLRYNRYERYDRDLSIETNDRSRIYMGSRSSNSMPRNSRYRTMNNRDYNNYYSYGPMMMY